ncbi:septum site-determining protein Ssd [Cellulosimicrobium arenosum]|uniref:Pilus assembly protein FlpE n=1 Tax=Cellulosimicrobium arenosum TaxID=2708133 RepID=A0A927G8H5_9MICO|nr:septum site-determining protein Ssd [Cellulosimicrobium arenosum]MBD8078881.1 pilus assembly protein FlpE [Cellulosimicrobium arenosum]
MTAAVVGVTGARGGAGASVVAAALARGAARGRRVPVCLVDLAAVGGGLDLLLGVEDAPGVRWTDLEDARGRLDGEDLAARLPRWDRVHVVSGTRAGGPPAGAVADVVAALADWCTARGGVVVLDLPRDVGSLAVRGLLDATTEVLVVTPLDVPAVAGAAAARDRLPDDGPPVALVVRGPAPAGLSRAEVADAVGLEVAEHVRWDRGVAIGVERGLGPCAGRGPLERAGRRLAARYLGPGGRG